MNNLSAVVCLVSVSILSGCVDDRGNRGSVYSSGLSHNRSCGNGENDISHPYAGSCDWRRENGRDWADSGANNNIYRRYR
ncbi:hypothetical protein QE435_000035 [Rhizobium sp. SORGH_AS 787]|nr:hypothetical protein [Rhizobium sp. SORGH_AS_0787]